MHSSPALSPIAKQRNGSSSSSSSSMTNLLTPSKSHQSMLSSTRLTPIRNTPASTRYALSKAPPPEESTSRAPKMVKFNSNSTFFSPSKVGNFPSNVITREQFLTHQSKYGRAGLFPVVHFYRKKVPVITPRQNSCVIRLSSSGPSLFGDSLEEMQNASIANTSGAEAGAAETSTRSVLDALKEISRKRIQSNATLEKKSKPEKRTQQDASPSENNNPYAKRSRDEEDVSPTTAPSTSKRICVVDAIYASNTSSLCLMNNKRKLNECWISPSETKPTKKLATVETQTNSIEPIAQVTKNMEENDEIEEVSEELANNVEEKEDETKVSSAESNQRMWDEKVYAIHKKNKLAMVLSRFTGEEPQLIPVPRIWNESPSETPSTSESQTSTDSLTNGIVEPSTTSFVPPLPIHPVPPPSVPQTLDSVTVTTCSIPTPILSVAQTPSRIENAALTMPNNNLPLPSLLPPLASLPAATVAKSNMPSAGGSFKFDSAGISTGNVSVQRSETPIPVSTSESGYNLLNLPLTTTSASFATTLMQTTTTTTSVKEKPDGLTTRNGLVPFGFGSAAKETTKPLIFAPITTTTTPITSIFSESMCSPATTTAAEKTTTSGGGFAFKLPSSTTTAPSPFARLPGNGALDMNVPRPTNITTPSLFGSKPSTTSIFSPGFITNPTTTTTTIGNLFGNTPTTSTTMFGAGATMFGVTTTTTTTTTSSTTPAFVAPFQKSVFNTPASKNMFGSSVAATTTTTPSTIFGNTGMFNFGSNSPATAAPFGMQLTTTTTGGGGASLFGANTATTTNATSFGSTTTLFGARGNESAPIFGSASPQTATNVFNSNVATFGQPALSNGFGSSSTTLTSKTAFGSTPTFGSFPTPTTTSAPPTFGNTPSSLFTFGSSQSSVAPSPAPPPSTTSSSMFAFGATPTPALPPPAFGAQPNSPVVAFGKPAPPTFGTPNTFNSPFAQPAAPNFGFGGASNVPGGFGTPAASSTSFGLKPDQAQSVFSFGAADLSKNNPGAFNFSASASPTPHFGAGFPQPQSGGMFSIGSGSTTTNKRVLRAKRRT